MCNVRTPLESARSNPSSLTQSSGKPALGGDPIGTCIARAHKSLDGAAREVLGCEKLYFDTRPGASDVVDTWVAKRTVGSKGVLSAALSGELSKRGREF